MISIVTPSFNKASFISETIHSVLHQSWPDWELIIVDDGSTDKTIEIAENFSTNDNRIKLIKRNSLPTGGSACRNIGIEKASGDYIVFLDADDVLHLDCLKHRINQINQFPHFSFWVFPIGTFYTNIGDSKSKWIPKGKDHLQKFLSHNMPWHTMSVIWQREFVTRLNGFDPEYPRLQDVELHTRALLRNNISYKTFPECTPDAWYRIDGHRTAQNLEKQLLNQWLGIQMYIQKTYPILNKNKYKAALKGTLISFINSINYHCIVNAKKITLHKELLKDISLFLKKECVFHNIDLYYINTYIQLYKAGLWKIKGFNYLMKKIFYTYSLFLQNK